ncbi:DNA polymerase III subunit gamma/tau [Bifidobacterium sp. UBA744]|uniref:DNA polymerase III subunit gamma/tau n=1 Tax=Bifidobacterium sp. UBA744 TaxID=1946112 RepID=UPI0025C55A95|nr:DNA polymerase III subunit gamma/tau [Bifidobacterium sp. UBA744]
MALALYRRYRPDTFEGVIGQDQVTVPLMRALDEGKLTHAYLFSGPRGCGKTSSARILARCVNCAKGPTSHPCGECESCRDLATGGPGSIDVVEIDAASHNGVDDARELRDRVAAMPARDRYKIFILDEAHMVTPQGFNALLKTVEEPPDHVMFIFATTEPDKVIGTIRSRTHHYPFRLVPPEVMGPYLEDICAKEGIKPETGVLKLAMRAGGGSMRDTLSVLDQLMVGSVDGVITQDSAVSLLGFTPDALIGESIDALIDQNGERLYGVIQKVIIGGFDPRRFVEDLLARVRDLLVLTLGGSRAEAALSDDAAADDMTGLKRQAGALGLARLTDMADVINDALGSMSGATSPRMRLELLAARLLAGSPTGAMRSDDSAPDAAVGDDDAAGNAGGGSSRRVGFAGALRNRSAGGSAGGFAGSARRQSAAEAPAATVSAATVPGAVDSDHETKPPVSDGPSAEAPVPDSRTPDERWDALVAGLPDDVAKYVNRQKVPRIKLQLGAQAGSGRLWVKFDTPISKYAFAMGVSEHEVGGTHKVVDIVRGETKRLFGDRVQLAPTEKMADGQIAPPLSRLAPEERARVKSQIAMANAGIAAAGLAAAIAPRAEAASGNASQKPQTAAPSGQAVDSQESSDADDAHRGGWPDTGHQIADDDPWASPRHVAGTHETSPTGGVSDERHVKHVTVPDIADGIDPWAAPTAGTAPEAPSAAPGAERPEASAQAGPSASEPASASATAPASESASSSGGPSMPPREPEPGLPGPAAGERDPWSHPAAQTPTVDAEDDEYSMSDESLGQATAMDLNDLKKMFEVKKVEDFAPDDPHNPNNIQRKNHDGD